MKGPTYPSNIKIRKAAFSLLIRRSISRKDLLKISLENFSPKNSRKENENSYPKRNFMERPTQGALFVIKRDILPKLALKKRKKSSFSSNLFNIQT